MKLIFQYLAILNLADGILTFIGLKYNFIEESNPLMHFLYYSEPLLFLAAKAFLSLLLLGFVFLHKVPNTTIVRRLSLFASFGYTFVLFIHCYWLMDVVTLI